MQEKQFIREQGITLVALIITIIILIILAAVTINAVFKSNFIQIATDGTENYSKAQVNEKNKTDQLAEYLQESAEKIENVGIGNNAPEIQSVRYVDKTTNSIIIEAVATDVQNDNLTYTIYTKGEKDTDWIEGETKSNQIAGTPVTLTASDLSEYTYYEVKVRATKTETRETLSREELRGS